MEVEEVEAELEDADNAILRCELLGCCVGLGRVGGWDWVGATGTGMCLCGQCAGAGAHISRDCPVGPGLLSRIRLASHSFLCSLSLAPGMATGLLRVLASTELLL